MHFDDRLATVLRLPATGDSLARIQYRQLVDILSRMPDSARGADSQSPLEEAFAALEMLKMRISAIERARLIAQSGHPLANPRLVSQLAQAEPPVALAAIGRAHLSESAWLTLIPSLPVGARGILRHRSDLAPSVEALLDRLGVQDRTLPQNGSDTGSAHLIEQPTAASEPAVEDALHPTSLPPLELELAAIFGEDYDAPQAADTSPDTPTPSRLFAEPAPDFTPATISPVSLTEIFDPLAPETGAPERAKSSNNVHALHPTRPVEPRLLETRPDSEIGAIVRRIEAYRKAREANPANHTGDISNLPRQGAPAAAPARLPSALDFETDSLGRIIWAEGPYAPAIVGMQLALGAASAPGRNHAPDTDTRLADALRTAFAERRPLIDHTVQLDGSELIRGSWRVDATPDFASSGSFRGYYGRLRRRSQSQTDQIHNSNDLQEAGLSGRDDDGDGPGGRLREVLHELRTPANAIQVAAEIIQQQLYGPAPHEYRALAAAVAGDCAHILAGFEELERLVKLETGMMKLDSGECEFTAILSHVAERLRTWTQPRRSGFSLLNEPGDIRVSLTSSDAEMLAWRLLAALAGSTAPDEVLEIGWQRDTAQGPASDMIAIRSALPARLSARDGDDFFATAPGERGQSLAVGAFGTGFTLRLAAAEARAAGGGMHRDGNDLVLWLPALTAASSQHSSFDSACISV